MDDQINEKIKSILSDPDSLKSLLSIASALGVGRSANVPEESLGVSDERSIPAAEDAGQEKSDEMPTISEKIPSAQSLAALTALGSKPQYADSRVNLLLSIKPFLSERKRQRVDSLVKALGAAKLISSYKDLDILSKFL